MTDSSSEASDQNADPEEWIDDSECSYSGESSEQSDFTDEHSDHECSEDFLSLLANLRTLGQNQVLKKRVSPDLDGDGRSPQVFSHYEQSVNSLDFTQAFRSRETIRFGGAKPLAPSQALNRAHTSGGILCRKALGSQNTPESSSKIQPGADKSKRSMSNGQPISKSHVEAVGPNKERKRSSEDNYPGTFIAFILRSPYTKVSRPQITF